MTPPARAGRRARLVVAGAVAVSAVLITAAAVRRSRGRGPDAPAAGSAGSTGSSGSAGSAGSVPAGGDLAALLATFHDVERATLTRFNGLLRQARGGADGAAEVGDLTVAEALERELLPPWRALDARAAALAPADAGAARLRDALRAYAGARARAWEHLAAALREPDPARKRAALDAYHAGNAEATEGARALAALLPRP